MVDLVSQYEKIKTDIDAGIMEVVETTAFINGPQVKAFENELASFLNVKYVKACANGTDALQIAMMALDLKPGDEVITANFTYVATAEAIALLGLKPVLVDAYPDTFNINVAEIEKAITSKTKAIVPVHLFGQSCDMEPILALAKKHNLYVIEDNAQAIAAEYTFSDGTKAKTGTMGHIGTTSFFPSKNLGCMGDGGALCTNDEEIYKKLNMVANHGQSKMYYHDMIGVNSRLDSMQAAILRVKLRYLNDYCTAREKAASYYDAGFAQVKGLTTPFRAKNSTHVFHQYVLKLDTNINREALRNYLTEKNIPSNVYYPVPLNHQKAYASAVNDRDFPVTYALCESVLALPMHTEFEMDQLDYIISTVKEFISKN